MPKSNAENCKNYRNRKNANKIKRVRKTNAERCQMYRLRKRILAQGYQLPTNQVLPTLSTSNLPMTFESSALPVTTDKTIGKRFAYVGDFTEEDMDSPTKAKEFFNLSKQNIEFNKKKISVLQKKSKRLEKRVTKLQNLLWSVKKTFNLPNIDKELLELQAEDSEEYDSISRSKKTDFPALQQNTLLSYKTEEERVTPDNGMKGSESSNLEVMVEQKILPDLTDESCLWPVEPSTSIVIKQEIIEIEDDEANYFKDFSKIPYMPSSTDTSHTLSSYSVAAHSFGPPLKTAKAVTSNSLEHSEISPLTEQSVSFRQSAIKTHEPSTCDSQIKDINSKIAMSCDKSIYSDNSVEIETIKSVSNQSER